MKSRKKIGIALSGGGIKGVAHIGVFKALEELDIEVDIIAGTSAGAIMGSLFAAGLSWQEVKEFVDSTRFSKAFFPGFTSRGLLKHDFLKSRLKRYLPVNNFEELQTELHVLSTNLNTGKPQIFSQGDIIAAVAASSSIPVLFSPEEINGNLYSDGGILANLPALPIKDKCDLLIGINLIPRVELAPKDFSGVLSSLSVAARTFYLTIQNNSYPDKQLCDLIIEPDNIQDHHIFSFNKIEEIFESGYSKTMEMKEEILKQVYSDSLS